MARAMPDLRKLPRLAGAAGCLIEEIHGTGELRVSKPGQRAVIVNRRRKDGTRALLSLVRRAEKE